MKRLIRALTLLYPSKWRRRYGDEFLCLVDDANSGWHDALDVLKGGLVMRFSSSNIVWMAVAWGILGFLLTGLVATRMPDVYRAQVLMTTKSNLVGAQGLMHQTFSDQRLAKIVTAYDLYRHQYEWYRISIGPALSVEERVALLRQNLQVMTAPPGLVKVVYSGRDPALVPLIANQMASLLAEAANRDWRIVDPARIPEKPFRPNRPLIVVDGTLFGAFLGTLLALIRQRPMRLAS